MCVRVCADVGVFIVCTYVQMWGLYVCACMCRCGGLYCVHICTEVGTVCVCVYVQMQGLYV